MPPCACKAQLLELRSLAGHQGSRGQRCSTSCSGSSSTGGRNGCPHGACSSAEPVRLRGCSKPAHFQQGGTKASDQVWAPADDRSWDLSARKVCHASPVNARRECSAGLELSNPRAASARAGGARPGKKLCLPLRGLRLSPPSPPRRSPAAFGTGPRSPPRCGCKASVSCTIKQQLKAQHGSCVSGRGGTSP